MQELSDSQLVSMFESSNYAENDQAMLFLYDKMYRKIENYIKKNSGNEQDAADIFQDALIALYKTIRTGRLNAVDNIQGYFFRICRNLWLKKLKKSERITALTNTHDTIAEEATTINTIISQEKSSLLNQLLGSLGESCKKVLIYFYYERLKMVEIMERMSFSSEQVAKNKKALCMKKLKETVAANPGLKDLLI